MPPRPTLSHNAADALADLTGGAWFEVDAERNVVALSPAMEELTGFALADVTGRSCLTLHRCEECLRGCGVFLHGELRDIPLTLFRADGTPVDVVKSGRLLRGGDGTILGAVEVVRPAADGTGARGDGSCAAQAHPEAERIRKALEQAHYRKGAAAALLGMSRTTLWRKAREYGL